MHVNADGISAVIVSYNNENVIERCLKSLKGVVNEIIVLHDGECIDDTLSIVTKYTDKVFIESHKGEAELHNTRALDYTKYEWILRIDADEFLSEDLRFRLRDLINDGRYDLYAFIWPIWNGKYYLTKDFPYKDALFRRSKIYSIDFPHKLYSTHGTKRNEPLLLEHRPAYDNYTLDAFRKKWIRMINIQALCTYNHKNTRFYNFLPVQVDNFHKTMEKQIMFAQPILTPIWFCISFIKFFTRLKVWSNPKTLKIAFLQGLYAGWLCYFIWKAKNLDN